MRYYKNIANLLLWELWECLAITIKIIASISSSRCYILKNPAIWLADIISLHNSKTRIFPDMGLVKKNNNKISFHFRLFPRKTNDKIFQKIKNPPFFAVILGGQKWIFLQKNGSVSYLPSDQKSEKTIEPFLRKMPNWHTDRKRWFYRTLRRTGVQKTKLPKVTWVYLPEKNFLWKTGSDIWTIFHWVVIIAYQYFNSLDQFYFFDLTTTLGEVLQNLYEILEK